MKFDKKLRSNDFAKYVVGFLADLRHELKLTRKEKQAVKKILKFDSLEKHEKKELKISLAQAEIIHKTVKAIYKEAEARLGFYANFSFDDSFLEMEMEDDFDSSIENNFEVNIGENSNDENLKGNNSNVNDLTLIEGIGAKIQELLNAEGIYSFGDLATTSPDELKQILVNAGSRFSPHNPKNWPKQAILAAEDKWDELKVLQAEL